ncbi:MAG: MarC family protein [Bacteroidaceae bacterium]|nr:MarC family protein [Bacteroidaceae bacterium]MBR6196948.1 MarC family protein [Bacteroidaceae bacterium]
MAELFNFQEFISAFLVMFAVIDIIGATPIIISLRQQGKEVSAAKTCIYSFVLLLGFFFAGNMILQLFQIDIASFALAGSIVVFIMALEMVLNIEIFKSEDTGDKSTLVPLVFPLIAGAGAFTTLISLKSQYATPNIILAVLANIVVIYFVIAFTGKFQDRLSKEFIIVLRKFFGIILIAIAAQLFTTNIQKLLLMGQ